MEPIDRTNAEHYVWGQICDGWHLVKHPGLSVITERVPPGAAEVRHIHGTARQFFFVLRGRAVLEIDGDRVALAEGQGVEVTPGLPHQFRNESDAPVDFLVVSQPTTRGDRTDL